jgi:hypothetical protein
MATCRIDKRLAPAAVVRRQSRLSTCIGCAPPQATGGRYGAKAIGGRLNSAQLIKLFKRALLGTSRAAAGISDVSDVRNFRRIRGKRGPFEASRRALSFRQAQARPGRRSGRGVAAGAARLAAGRARSAGRDAARSARRHRRIERERGPGTRCRRGAGAQSNSHGVDANHDAQHRFDSVARWYYSTLK